MKIRYIIENKNNHYYIHDTLGKEPSEEFDTQNMAEVVTLALNKMEGIVSRLTHYTNTKERMTKEILKKRKEDRENATRNFFRQF